MTFGICLDVLVMTMLFSFDRAGMTSWWHHNDVIRASIWRVIEICRYFTIELAVSAEKHRFSHISGKVFYQWFETFTLQKKELNWILEFILFDYTILFSFQRKTNIKKYNPIASRPKRKSISGRDQEELMQEFYDQSDKDNSEFFRKLVCWWRWRE